MAHDHSHEAGESYFQEQLSTIALCGGFAAAAIALYYWQRPIMVNMGFQGASLFPTFIVWSGFALLVLVVLRAVSLWKTVGQPAAVAVHSHAHEHEGHTHSHEHHEHEHGNHDHAHSHDCCHEHAVASCGHDHGASFWRYIVLLVPLILFLLGLPNKGPSAGARELVSGPAGIQEAPAYGALVSVGPLPLQQIALAAAATYDPSSQFEEMGNADQFRLLYNAAQDPALRKEWEGKMVRVVGVFAPHPRSNRDFNLLRFRVQCCSADAVPYAIPAFCAQGVTKVGREEWVQVIGRVHFQHNSRGSFMTALIVPKPKDVLGPLPPDPNPYITQ